MSLFMCENCLRVFKEEYLGETKENCPIAGCDGDLFHIDEEMIPVIRSLILKGYKTMYCCQGHCYSKKLIQIYIMLNGDMEYNHFDNIEPPENYKMRNSTSLSIVDFRTKIPVTMIESIINFDESVDELEVMEEVIKRRISLMKWVKNLRSVDFGDNE